jgi:hypothetical protein
VPAKRSKTIKPTKQLPITILSIDQASNSGWCIQVLKNSQYVYHSSGSCSTALERQSIVDTACELGRPVLAVYELHAAFGPRKVCMGLGRALGAWLQALELRSVTGRSLVAVRPQQWRSELLGLSARCGTDEAKEAARVFASQFVGSNIDDLDESEGIAIGRWYVEKVISGPIVSNVKSTRKTRGKG